MTSKPTARAAAASSPSCVAKTKGSWNSSRKRSAVARWMASRVARRTGSGRLAAKSSRMNRRTRSLVLRAGAFAFTLFDDHLGGIFVERLRKRREFDVERALSRRRNHELPLLGGRSNRGDLRPSVDDLDRRPLAHLGQVVSMCSVNSATVTDFVTPTASLGARYPST